jgi:MFS family permease
VLDFLPAFLVDLAAYVAIFTLQHELDARLVARGSSSELALAVFSACYTVTYMAGCIGIGPRTDRTGLRRKSIAFGVGLATCVPLALVALVLSGNEVPVGALYGAMLVLGVGSAFYWPAQEARIADRAGREALGPALARFNVGWTSGKALGFFFAGDLYDLAPTDGRAGLLAAAGAFALAFAISVLFDREAGKHEGRPLEAASERPLEEKRGFLVAALVTNVAVWGAQQTVIALVPVLGRELDLGHAWEARLLSVLVFSQALVFIALRGTNRWAYRKGPLLALAPLAVLSALAFFLAPNLPVALVAALVTGLLTGVSYAASLFYSLDYDERRGLRMGVNEALIGLGSLLPLAGTAIAERVHESRVPYLFLAWVSFAAALVSGAALRPRRVAA